MASASHWKLCNICKKPISFQQTYYICSVSTCQRKRTGLVFCSVSCFDAHLPMMRHRDAWAEELTAPTQQQAEREAREEQAQAAANASSTPQNAPVPPPVQPVVRRSASASAAPPTRRVVSVPGASSAAADNTDVLVVVSKLKKFIRDQSGMNTSDTAMGVLSDHLRDLSVRALRHAAADGRKTVLDRDFSAVLRELSNPR